MFVGSEYDLIIYYDYLTEVFHSSVHMGCLEVKCQVVVTLTDSLLLILAID